MKIYTMHKDARTDESVYITVPDPYARFMRRIYRELRMSGLNDKWARWRMVDLLGIGINGSCYSFEEDK